MIKVHFDDLTPVDQDVLRVLNDEGVATTSKIMELINTPHSLTKPAIDNLRAHGLIQIKVGKGYEVLPRGRRVFQNQGRS